MRLRQVDIIIAASIVTPAVTSFQSATSSLRAGATMVAFLRRPPRRLTRSSSQIAASIAADDASRAKRFGPTGCRRHIRRLVAEERRSRRPGAGRRDQRAVTVQIHLQLRRRASVPSRTESM
jgi:hypothetical protein